MKKSKIIILTTLIILTVAIVISVIIVGNIRYVRAYDLSKTDSCGFVQFNRWSTEPYTLYPYNGSLYFYSEKQGHSGLDDGLYKVAGNRAIKVFSIEEDNQADTFFVGQPLCFINGHFIYYSLSDDSQSDAILSLDIETGTKKSIIEGETVSSIVYEMEYYTPIAETTNGSLVYKTESSKEILGSYFTISENFIIFHDEYNHLSEYVNGSFVFGDFEYRWDDVFFVQSAAEKEEIIDSFYPGQIFEVLDGDMLVVRKGGTSGFLSISKDGVVKELFPVLKGENVMLKYCVHENYMYVSIRRYKIYRKLDNRRFKNDSEEGLWMINMQSGERKKISKTMYSSLVLYGDSCIVASTYSKDIVILDFDGKIRAKMLSGNLREHFDEFWRNNFSKAE